MNRIMVTSGSAALALFGVLFSGDHVAAEMPQMLTRSTSPSPAISWHEDLQSGWRESQRRRVPMVIYITSDNCTYCDAMKRDTWCDASVTSRVRREFVAIRLSRRKNSATLSRIKVKMYPTTLIGIPEGKVVSHREGYQPASAIHQLLSNARHH